MLRTVLLCFFEQKAANSSSLVTCCSCIAERTECCCFSSTVTCWEVWIWRYWSIKYGLLCLALVNIWKIMDGCVRIMIFHYRHLYVDLSSTLNKYVNLVTQSSWCW